MPDGNIEFLGRSDFQVKIRGFRVELGEIEAALESITGVRQAIVVARERSSGDLELVAYVSSSEGDRVPDGVLRARLLAQLPEYMVPTIFIAIEQFPQTPSGKVDRKALPAPVRVRPQLSEAFVAPRTQVESLVAEKWRQLLDIDRVGIHDRFFELGGTSLQAAHSSTRCRRSWTNRSSSSRSSPHRPSRSTRRFSRPSIRRPSRGWSAPAPRDRALVEPRADHGG